jgi:hypothetical protein
LNGISFGELSISQGTGNEANHSIVKIGTEILFVVQNIDAAALTSPDFTPI